MPLYSTVSHMLATIPVVSSRTNATSADLSVFLTRAEGVMDAKLAKRYALPLTGSYQILNHVATDLSCYYFLSRRVFTQERANDSTWPDRFKESMELLDSIASGEIPLVGADGAVLSPSSALLHVWSSTEDYEPTMTEDIEANQVVDPDKIDDLRADREV